MSLVNLRMTTQHLAGRNIGKWEEEYNVWRGSRLQMETKLPSQMTGVCLFAAIVENMAEFRPEMCTEAAQQGLLQWLLKRLKAKMPFDANKLYCSEVLAILLQDNDGEAPSRY